MIRLVKLVEMDALKEKVLNGPGKEDPDTSGLKFNTYPTVPKQQHISPYDSLDEQPEDQAGAINAVDNYINGNISDFKEWLQDPSTTKTEIIDALSHLVQSSNGAKTFRGMINNMSIVSKYLEGK